MGAGRQVWRFANCEFDELRHELRVRGALVEVESKPLDVLHVLLLHGGDVVTKDELLERAWPGLLVVDASLATAVSKLRKALGDDGIVLTVPRVGYRLGVAVQSWEIPQETWRGLRLQTGDVVPGREQWRLSRRLGASSSSEVWLAAHPKTSEQRVFKFATDEAWLCDLEREVTLSRLLSGALGERPEFVRILEWNFTSPPYFIESEYVGPNLAEWAELQGGLLAVDRRVRLRLAADITRAVADAHALDVLHKDLKPGNILVSNQTNGEPRISIADFGCAALLAPERLETLGITNRGFTQVADDASVVTGTVPYVAPEVLAGRPPSAAADVYALGVLLYQLAIGDFRKPLAPGWEAEVADPLLCDDIALAASGDPEQRIGSAAALADRLASLDRRRIERRRLDQASIDAGHVARRRVQRPWLLLAAAVALAIGGATAWGVRMAPAAPVKTLAVLPFSNLTDDRDLDFLRLAVPDEIATALTHTHGLAVTPFSSTSGLAPNLDLATAARELHADAVVTGRFVRSGTQLHITLEAVDLGNRHTVWRDTIDTPSDSFIAVQVQIALRVNGGLAPVFGASPGSDPRPANETAYELFLRSMTLPFETSSNPDGIAMLERAVALDPGYAPAWVALARRYYVDERYSGGPEAQIQRYEQAMERAASLDPDYAPAAAGLIVGRVERGELGDAYLRAADLVRRRPDSADAQFALSYVLRSAGLLQEAGEHCDRALLLDPHSVTSGLRSCAIVFFLRGDYPRAKTFQQLYLGSDWAKAFSLDIAVREGALAQAVQIGPPHIPRFASYDMLAACIESGASGEVATLASRIQPSDDPESNYLAAAHLAYCHHDQAAIALLHRAIDGHYCAYPALDVDPLLANLRHEAAFADLRAAGRQCQLEFLARRGNS